MAWEAAQHDGLDNPDTLVPAAHLARATLEQGGNWPDTAWVESILMIGANCSAAAVLNHGMYVELKDTIGVLYQEVLDRRWLQGGPTGLFEQSESEGLSRAVGQWQLHATQGAPAPEKKRKGFFGRS
jgi:hypothetical protein